jgi:hypothetical protein
MATLVFRFRLPGPAATVGRRIAVSMQAASSGSPLYPVVEVDDVRVVFGDGGPEQVAELAAGIWKCQGSPLPTVPGNSSVTLTAIVRGTRTPNAGTPTEPRDGTPVPFEDKFTRVVRLSEDVPEGVTIHAFETPVTPETLPYHLALTGTANDTVNGIRSVKLRVNTGPFVDVDTDERFGVIFWTKEIDLPAGSHDLTVRAVDGAGNIREASKVIRVREPAEPGEAQQAFEPTRYLRQLLKFTGRYVTLADSTTAVTPAMLADRFHQPFDRLTEPILFDRAVRPVAQARIAVEVLRGRLGHPAPAELERRFRALAYQTFLRAIGTSHDELRLARTRDARAALAQRLGIGLVPDAADRLAELAVSPEKISDTRLEELTGYRSTRPADVLHPPTGGAKILLWRQDTLSARWELEDQAALDSAAGPLSVIDPDLIDEAHLREHRPTDPAFALWTARRAWLADKQAEIEPDTGPGPNQITRFDHAVATHVGDLNLPRLAARDANGVDIQPDLAALDLDLAAFRFLARSRALLVAHLPLDTEWEDVAAILLQVQKRRQFLGWRVQERRAGIVLSPASFTLPDAASSTPDLPRWRFSAPAYLAWRRTLVARTAAAAAAETDFRRTVEAVEDVVLPALRDALIAEATDDASRAAAADQLTRELMIDLQAAPGQRTTRAEQALSTLQAALFAIRASALAGADGGGPDWTIAIERGTDRLDFDREWAWIGSYRTWLAATRVFAYPENQLLPALYVADSDLDPPTSHFRDLIQSLRKARGLDPDGARDLARAYLDALRKPNSGVVLEKQLTAEPGPGKPVFTLTEERTDHELVELKNLSTEIYDAHAQHQREIFWLVPMALAAKLQEARHFQAALDWYRTVFAYHLPPNNRRIYRGLFEESRIDSNYDQVPEWLIAELNPHLIAGTRRNCYSRATVMAIVGCLHAFADAEFGKSTPDGNARARTLYEAAADLLRLAAVRPETGDDIPFPPNPVWESLRQQGRAGLSKIHLGLNIAGASTTGTATEDDSVLPSQYRYSVLIERTKNLVASAQQMEAAYLSALEQRDAKAYDELRARNDLEVTRATVDLHTTKLAEAVTGVRLAQLQRTRAQLQQNHYDKLIEDGYSKWEQAGIAGLGAAAYLHLLAGKASLVSGLFDAVTLRGNPAKGLAESLTAFAQVASTTAQIAQTVASLERRAQEWQLQKELAAKDGEIADKQIQAADLQLKLAGQERQLAVLQQDHAEAVATFLATRFTNAELFEWMSGVLGRVYSFFLQQGTALAQLAEAQLAFERQELPVGFIGSDYWRDAAAGADAPDRRGLTGSARLLQDVTRLDQFAFETDRRKLHLTQTFALSQIAAFELQLFRETGVLTFATPQELFDREFPGHFLRLVKRVRMSLIALLPPVRGVRATLAASGVSRVVVTRGPFDTVILRREPESIAFTSPTNATGLFELEPEGGLLLPFEGMGVDTVWQLDLPKAANPFDYRSIADVLLSIEYTALDSAEYRERVIRELDRRFSGDRTFSVRNQFPDAWFDLNNPDNVDPEQRMRAVLPLTADDFPPHIEDLHVEHVSLFVVRADTLADELTISSVSHTSSGQTVTTDSVPTTGGIISTRRPAGAVAWQVLLNGYPAGRWEIQLPDVELVRSWFRDGLIEDLVLVLTVGGTTPEWP